jgi:hypothetical protein
LPEKQSDLLRTAHSGPFPGDSASSATIPPDFGPSTLASVRPPKKRGLIRKNFNSSVSTENAPKPGLKSASARIGMLRSIEEATDYARPQGLWAGSEASHGLGPFFGLRPVKI